MFPLLRPPASTAHPAGNRRQQLRSPRKVAWGACHSLWNVSAKSFTVEFRLLHGCSTSGQKKKKKLTLLCKKKNFHWLFKVSVLGKRFQDDKLSHQKRRRRRWKRRRRGGGRRRGERKEPWPFDSLFCLAEFFGRGWTVNTARLRTVWTEKRAEASFGCWN